MVITTDFHQTAGKYWHYASRHCFWALQKLTNKLDGCFFLQLPTFVLLELRGCSFKSQPCGQTMSKDTRNHETVSCKKQWVCDLNFSKGICPKLFRTNSPTQWNEISPTITNKWLNPSLNVVKGMTNQPTKTSLKRHEITTKSPRNHLRFQLRCQTAQGAQGCDQDLVIFGGDNYENHQAAIDFTIFYPYESGISHYESLLISHKDDYIHYDYIHYYRWLYSLVY